MSTPTADDLMRETAERARGAENVGWEQVGILAKRLAAALAELERLRMDAHDTSVFQLDRIAELRQRAEAAEAEVERLRSGQALAEATRRNGELRQRAEAADWNTLLEVGEGYRIHELMAHLGLDEGGAPHE